MDIGKLVRCFRSVRISLGAGLPVAAVVALIGLMAVAYFASDLVEVFRQRLGLRDAGLLPHAHRLALPGRTTAVVTNRGVLGDARGGREDRAGRPRAKSPPSARRGFSLPPWARRTVGGGGGAGPLGLCPEGAKFPLG